MKLNQEVIEKLAAEYALGSLKGGARRRFETLLRENAQVRLAASVWQDRLHPMGLMATPVEPRPEVWKAIEARTVGAHMAERDRSPVKQAQSSVNSALRFWRWLGLSSTAFAAVLLAVLLFGGVLSQKPAPALPAYMAVMADDKAEAFFVASATSDGQLRIHLLRQPAIPADRSLELWAVPPNGKPKSLGLLTEGRRELKLEPGRTPAQAPVLAISLEPAGGSTNPDGPSGPVLYSGKWLPA